MRIAKYPFVVYSTEEITGIVFMEFPGPLKVDLQVAKDIVANRLDFTGNKEHYLVMDISNVREVTTEAKEYLQDQEAGLKNILGAAFIATNPVSALIARIFIKTPTRFNAELFSEKVEAYNWISGLRLVDNPS